jgi:hypothetical protein
MQLIASYGHAWPFKIGAISPLPSDDAAWYRRVSTALAAPKPAIKGESALH